MFKPRSRASGCIVARYANRCFNARQTGTKLSCVAWLVALSLLAIFPAIGHAQISTTTTLSVNPSTEPYGTAFNMAATVTPGVSSTHPMRGSVSFTDTVSGVSRVLGIVQVQSAAGVSGRAVLHQRLSTLGTHSVTATYTATNYFLASSSAAQALSVTGLYPTSTALAATGGTTGNWSLTATVVSLASLSLTPTGAVSLQDASNGNYPVGSAALGTGTLARQTVAGPGSPIALGNNPVSVAGGDFNGDGFADLAILNKNDSTISILLGDATGGFAVAPVKPASGANTVAIVAADLDGDGNIDLLASSLNVTSVLLGNGDGTFKTARISSTPGTGSSRAIALGDFNRDGILDLVTVNTVGKASIFLGDGSGGFTVSSGSPLNVGIGTTAVAVGDFNGDGFLDFVTSNSTSATLTVMRGDGTGNAFVTSTIILPLGSNPSGVVADDFNGDGKLDLAVTQPGVGNVAILLGRGDTTFGAATTFATGRAPNNLITGDFNADGIRDLAVANQTDNTLTILLGNGSGSFTLPLQTISTSGSGPTSLAAADFNGDGLGDIAVANSASNNLSVLLNEVTDTAAVSFSAISIPGSGSHSLFAAYAGDLTNFAGSSSNKVTLAATPISTATLLSSTQSQYNYGQQAVFTATVAPTVVGTLMPTNADTVNLLDGAAVIGTGTLSGGVVTFNITSLTVGTHHITALFNGDTNFNPSTSAKLKITINNSQTPIITWSQPAAITYGTLLWTTQLNATATYNGSTVPGTFAYTPGMGAILTVGSHPLSVTFTPTDPAAYNSNNAATTIQVNQATPVLTWPLPASITYGTPLDVVQLNATATNTTIVPLSTYYNVNASYTAGTSFNTGGFDGDGNAYSANALGTSIVWNGVTYPLGPANAPDAVSNITTPIAVPVGYYASISLLGAMVNNSAANYTLTVNYTDGTSVPTTLTMSDWVYPQGYPDESVIKCNIARYTSAAAVDTHSTCVYGYTVQVDSTKIVQSLLLPQSREAVFLAMGATSVPIAGTFAYTPAAGSVLTVGPKTLATTFSPADTTNYKTASASVPMAVSQATSTLVWPTPASIAYGTPVGPTQLNAVATVSAGMVIPPVSASYRVSARFTDGQGFSVTGFGGTGYAYSATLLGSSILWNGTTFPLGPADLPNALTSSTIVMPQSQFYTLFMLGAANGNQPAQTFTINYADGTSVPTQLSLSSWMQPANYPGESIATSTAYLNTSWGGTSSAVNYIYGYQIALDSTKVLKSVTLPNNSNVVILSMALSTSANPAFTVPGATTYNPPAGTVLPLKTNPLAASFSPSDSLDYSSAAASTSILVTKNVGEPITLDSSANPSALFSAVIFTATLPNAATGTVTFFDGATSLGNGTLSSGVATLSTSSLTLGTHSITAVYNGDANYSSVTSAAVAQVVGKASASVTIGGVPNPSAYIQSVTMTITVVSVGGATPTGTVTLKDGVTALGPALPLDATGKATYSTISLSAGSHLITATYSGDANYN